MTIQKALLRMNLEFTTDVIARMPIKIPSYSWFPSVFDLLLYLVSFNYPMLVNRSAKTKFTKTISLFLEFKYLIKLILRDVLIWVSFYSIMYYMLSAVLLINIFSLISCLSKGWEDVDDETNALQTREQYLKLLFIASKSPTLTSSASEPGTFVHIWSTISFSFTIYNTLNTSLWIVGYSLCQTLKWFLLQKCPKQHDVLFNFL